MNSTPKRAESRATLRAILQGDQCIFPASVFDPISARIAKDVGYEMAMFAGSIASFTVLGAPDLVVLTLTELAEQARRICRASDIPVLVDADHGFGNALNVRRTVEELENAGVAGLTIEDTELPIAFDKPPKGLISIEETLGKFQAALDARQDPGLCIFGRSTAFSTLPTEAAVERIQQYAKAPVDGLFLVGIQTWQQLEAMRKQTSLPIILGGTPAVMKDPQRLSDLSVKIALEGHATFTASVTAVYETMRKMRAESAPLAMPTRSVPDNVIADVTRESHYNAWIQRYLKPH
jgi:carboxyvinyl-carboxyphosphonate phosphorylmutase